MPKRWGMNVTTAGGDELLPISYSDNRDALEEEARSYVAQHPGMWLSIDEDTWLEKHTKVTVNFFPLEGLSNG